MADLFKEYSSSSESGDDVAQQDGGMLFDATNVIPLSKRIHRDR